MKEGPADGPKVKRHWIYDHKYLAVFFVPIAFFVLANLVTLGLTFAGIDITDSEDRTTQLILSAESIGVALLMLLSFQFRFRKEFKGILKWSSVGLLLALPAILFAVLNVVSIDDTTFKVTFFPNLDSMNPFLYSLGMALSPGISEEIIFRGIPASNWMRVRSAEKRDVFPCVLVTSVVFGVVHGLNALMGAPITTTLFQVAYATCLGFLFCMVLLRTGSIIPCIIAHALIDFTGFLFMDMSQGGVITEELVIDLGFYVTLGVSIFMLLWSLVFLLPGGQDKIIALWDKKWHRRHRHYQQERMTESRPQAGDTEVQIGAQEEAPVGEGQLTE